MKEGAGPQIGLGIKKAMAAIFVAPSLAEQLQAEPGRQLGDPDR
jgi:hypothetical protein